MTMPIVLLHGANGSAQAVSPLAQALRERWPTVAIPNLLGHGGRQHRRMAWPAPATVDGPR